MAVDRDNPQDLKVVMAVCHPDTPIVVFTPTKNIFENKQLILMCGECGKPLFKVVAESIFIPAGTEDFSIN